MFDLKYAVVRDAYRLLCMYPSLDTILRLDSLTDDSEETRFVFWRQVALYATYCYHFQVIELLVAMMSARYSDKVRQNIRCMEVVSEGILLDLFELHLARVVNNKDEAELSQMTL